MSFNKLNGKNAQDFRILFNNILDANLQEDATTYLQEIQQPNPPSRWSSFTQNGTASEQIIPVDLVISNIDTTVDVNEMYNMLSNSLKEFCSVVSLAMCVEGNASKANVRVASYQEAQTVISQLDSKRLGCKRISISYLQSNVEQLRMMVISLLKDVPGQCMPLFRFFEIIRSRYLSNISLSEINNLKDVCKITEGSNGRMIGLHQKINYYIQSPITNTLNYYCTIHCPNGFFPTPSWGEVNECTLPNVRIPLHYFQNQVYQLLLLHSGCMPLLSFPICYAYHFKQPLPENETGVPLEHLLSCLSIVDLVNNEENKNIKYVKLKPPNDLNAMSLEDIHHKSISPDFIENVTMFCREMIDLLTNVKNCELLVNCFIPSYYRYFGKQCRVADYGFSRLSDLFEAVSHIVQVLGYGSKQILTLTHAVQIRRFTADLSKVINSQSSKTLNVVLFPHAYETVFFKKFDPRDYGVCTLEDLTCSVQKDAIVFSQIENIDVVSIRKRMHTAEETRRIQQFSVEVKTILQHFPNCSLAFNAFLPSYHHYFGRECKISDYGLTKLIELFEAIPETVEIDGFFDVDSKIKLALEPLLEVTAAKLVTLIKRSNFSALSFDLILSRFRDTFDYNLKPETYDCSSLLELFIKLGDFVQVHYTRSGPVLSVVDNQIQELELRLWAMLLNSPYKIELKKLKYHYRLRYENNLPIHKLQDTKSIQVSKNEDNIIVSLTPFYELAAKLYRLLVKTENRTQLSDLLDMYLKEYDTHLSPTEYGARSFKQLLVQMEFLVTITKESNYNYVTLNQSLSNYGVFVRKSMEMEPFSWPLLPLHTLTRRSYFISPPKPETPPLPGCWSDELNFSPESPDLYQNLQIPLLLDERKVGEKTNLNASIPPSIFDRNAIFEDSGYGGLNNSMVDSNTTYQFM